MGRDGSPIGHWQDASGTLRRGQWHPAIGPPDWVENAGTPHELWAYRDEGGIMGWLMPMYVPFDANGKVEGPPFS